MLEWLALQAKHIDVLRALLCGALCNLSLDDVLADQVKPSNADRKINKILVEYTALWKRPRYASPVTRMDVPQLLRLMPSFPVGPFPCVATRCASCFSTLS